MASYGGETPVNVPAVITSLGVTGTKYTVPSGRYARVWVKSLATYPGTGGAASLSIGAITYSTSWNFELFELVLTEGQAVTWTSGATSVTYFQLTAIEYNNPS